jgi:hypothetical protein
VRRACARLLLLVVVLGASGYRHTGDDATAGPDPDAPALAVYNSEHYRLETNVDAATSQGYLRMLEAQWPQLEAFFGAAPPLKTGEQLPVYVLAHAGDWQAKLTADGVRVPSGAGGYYHPGNRSVYLFRQPTIYNTRQLLLHETMHQFHYLARTHNTGPKDTWYVEGLVEHLSRHHWDGETLELGVVPFCSLEDYPAKALALFGQPEYDLAAMVASERPSTRPEQWALVRFLLLGDDGRHAKQWARLAQRLDAGQAARSVFRKTIGDPAKLLPALRAWLPTQQEPFVPVWNEWIGLSANGVEGTATVTSACRAREGARALAARLHVPEGPWKGGLLIGFEDPEACAVLLLDDRGGFVVNRRAHGAWHRLASGTAPPPREGTYHLQAVRTDAGVSLWANDVALGTFDLPGRKLGVCLDNCTLRFTEITWK